MELNSSWKKQPKDGASINLNRQSQPIYEHEIFNQTRLLTRSWYPLCPSKSLKSGTSPKSFTVGSQRVTAYRGVSGVLYALDSFCPHFGADLGNGSVQGENVQCYFHQWQFSGKDGHLKSVPVQERLPPCPKLNTYPICEKFGFIWVYSENGLQKDVPELPWSHRDGFSLTEVSLFVHHHALMMSAIDLHHFFSVHNLPIDFQFETEKKSKDFFHWKVEGEVPKRGFWLILFRKVVGKDFTYEAEFFGGNLVSISYGTNSHWFGNKSWPRTPRVQMLWASIPLKQGVSRSRLFVLHPPYKGFFGPLKKLISTGFSLMVLMLLKDDDIKAYPHMKFNPRIFIDKDRASVEFIKQIEQLEVSEWSFENSV